MVKRLQKHGNSHALVIEKSLLDALGIQPDTQLEVTVSGQSLVLTPINVGLGREGVAKSIKKLRPRYNKMLRNLAE